MAPTTDLARQSGELTTFRNPLNYAWKKLQFMRVVKRIRNRVVNWNTEFKTDRHTFGTGKTLLLQNEKFLVQNKNPCSGSDLAKLMI